MIKLLLLVILGVVATFAIPLDYYKNNNYNTNYNPHNGNIDNNYYDRSIYNNDYRRNYVPGAESNAKILRFDNNVQPDGTYVYAYDTDNGISVQQEGFPIQTADNEIAVGVKGYYQYTSPEGKQIITRYIADNNGYRLVEQ